MRLNRLWYPNGRRVKEVLNESLQGATTSRRGRGQTGVRCGTPMVRNGDNHVDDSRGLKVPLGGFAGRVLAAAWLRACTQLAGGDILSRAGKRTHRRGGMGAAL